MKVKPLRVLLVNHSLAMGGIETMMLDIVRLLPPEEFSVETAVFEGGGSLEETLVKEGVPVHDLRKHEGFDAGLAFRLRKLIRERQIDIVHSHNFSPWLYSCVAAKLAGGVTHIHTEHSGVEASVRRYAIERWLARLTTHVVAVSRHVFELMTKEIGISPDRVRLVYNGVHTRRFRPDAARREAVRAALGIAPETIVIGVLARLVPVKNHHHLLRAFDGLVTELGDAVRLLVVGDGGERAALEQLTSKLESSEQVTFLGERRDTEALLNAFDIYALSSISEGMNLTLLEAMSTGLPVVATDVGGNCEIVLDGETGFLVPLNDVSAMTVKLLQLAADSGLRERFGSAGREATIRRYGEETMINTYLQLYKTRQK